MREIRGSVAYHWFVELRLMGKAPYALTQS